ncbi:hypothetical protein GGI20_002873 [Coemansia sp. BCRC 34301]|nr:hypothetical protein GGI20_002873 [Coemansia sp. BCRC 34301]
MKRVRPSHGPANGSAAGSFSAAEARPFDLASVQQPNLCNPQGIASSLPPRKRMFGLPEAPTYYPTHEEFADPLAYIKKIRPEAEASGLCKIVPPEGWNPPFALDTTKFRFRTRVQQLNSLEGKTRTNLNYLDQLYKFHAQQGNPLPKVPQLDHRPIDLYELRHQVTIRGGFHKVNCEKRWAEIGRIMKYDRKSCTSMSTTLKATYTKIVMPFEIYIAKHGGNPPSSPGGAATDDATGSRRSKRNRMSADLNDSKATSLPLTRNMSPYGSETALGLAYPNNGAVDGLDVSEVEDDDDGDDGDIGLARAGASDKDSAAPIPERCEICKSGENDDKMLICDGCNRGFHMYCLLPRLKTIPNNDWYCDGCILRAGADFGFEDGAEHTLESFKNKNDEFKRSFFPEYYDDSASRRGARTPMQRPQMEGRVPEDKVEEEFWRLVASPFEDVEVEYGADLHSAQHGSGFPTVERDPTDPYSRHPWNLNVLPFQPQSLFNHIKQDISGMKTPWIYVGMCFSTFCWHNEDHYTYSVNYMHWGDTKTWYGVPGRHADQFEDAMRAAVPDLFKDQPDLLFQLVTMLSPGALVGRNVDVVSCDQRAGEFVVTFPQSYHAGFNQGFNFNEAVNFATSDWMPFDVPSVKRYQLYERNPVFSHDELVISMCETDPSFLHRAWFQEAILEMAHREKTDRSRVRNLWHTGIGEAAWDDVEEGDPDMPDEMKQQCYACKAFSFLSAVVCSCSPNYISCLAHAETSCKCIGNQKILKQRYSDRDLQALIDRCNNGPTSDSIGDEEQLHISPLEPSPLAPRSDADNGDNISPAPQASGSAHDGVDEKVANLSQSQIWEREFRRIMSLYSTTSPEKAPSSPGTSITAFAQSGLVPNGGVGDSESESDVTVSDDMRGMSQDPKTNDKRLAAAVAELKFPPRISKGTMAVAELNRRPDLMQMVLLLEEAQRLVLPNGGSQGASRRPKSDNAGPHSLPRMMASPVRRGRARGAKRRPGRPSNASRLLESMAAAKAAAVNGMVVSPDSPTSDGDPLVLLLEVVERLVTVQEAASRVQRPYGSKQMEISVDSQALGDMRQLGRFVQRAQEWCRAVQALLSFVGRPQMVETIQRKRQANYDWHREKLHRRFGDLSLSSTDDGGSHSSVSPTSISPFSAISGPAAPGDAGDRKHYIDDSGESSSGESSVEDTVDAEFKAAPVKRPVGRPRGSKRGRVAVSQLVSHNIGRNSSGRSLRSSASGMRSQSAEPRRANAWSSRLRTDEPSRTQNQQRSSERPRGLGLLSNAPSSLRGIPQQVEAVYLVLGDTLSSRRGGATPKNVDSSCRFSSSDVTSLLRIGEQLFFSAPEFEALIEYELEVLSAEAQVRAVTERWPAVMERLSSIPVALAPSTAEGTRVNKVDALWHQLENLRDNACHTKVHISRIEAMSDIVFQAQWFRDCHQQLARRGISSDAVASLLDDAERWGINTDSEPLKQLRNTQSGSEEWDIAAAATGLDESSRKPLDISEIAKLLEKGRNLPTFPENYHPLKRLLQTALDLQARADQLADRSERKDLAERPSCNDATALVAACDAFGRFVPSSLDRLRAEIAKVDAWRDEIGQLFSSYQYGGPLEDKLVGVQYRLRQTMAIIDGTGDAPTDLYCVCLRPESGLMVECDSCHEWYHPHCVNLEPSDIQNSQFLCSLCDAWARADRLRLLGEYPTLGRIERAVTESRSFGLVARALDPLVTILLDANTLVLSLRHLIDTRSTASAERMQQPAFLRSLLRALIGLGISLKNGLLDSLWVALSELLKLKPVPVITPGLTVTSRRSLRTKPVSTTLATEPGMLAQAFAMELLQNTHPVQQQQARPPREQVDKAQATPVENIPSDDIQPEIMDMYQSQLEELAIYIMHPLAPELDVGQGLSQARDTFKLAVENCLCHQKGSDFGNPDAVSMACAPTIQCDTCSEFYHVECVQVTIGIARIITFNQLKNRVNADVEEDIPDEPSRYACPNCCLYAGTQYPYGEIVFE